MNRETEKTCKKLKITVYIFAVTGRGERSLISIVLYLHLEWNLTCLQDDISGIDSEL